MAMARCDPARRVLVCSAHLSPRRALSATYSSRSLSATCSSRHRERTTTTTTTTTQSQSQTRGGIGATCESKLSSSVNQTEASQTCSKAPVTATATAVFIAVPDAPLFGETTVWLLESCIGIGSIKMGLPGLFAQLMYLAPLVAMKQICRERSVGRLPLAPYSMMILNGITWTVYGLLAQNPAIWIPMLSSVTLGSLYAGIFLRFCPTGADWLPGTRGHHCAVVTATAGLVGGMALCLPTDTALLAVGILGNVSNTCMFWGPLAAVKTVLREKSTRSLTFTFTVASFVNCSMWFAYGVGVIYDPLMSIPPFLGLVSVGAQLSLFARFGIHR